MDIREAEAFVYKEARLLDKYDLREWLTLFTEDALYWVPVNEENYDPTKHVSICYDNVTRLEPLPPHLILSAYVRHQQHPTQSYPDAVEICWSRKAANQEVAAVRR